MWSGGYMKLKSYLIVKLERNRTSILTDDLDTCYLCGRRKEHLHEIYFGKNRVNSMKYGCVVPLCYDCHNRVHNDIALDRKLKKICQLEFMRHYNCDEDDFIKIFHKNYTT